jgi:hypothetical protein
VIEGIQIVKEGLNYSYSQMSDIENPKEVIKKSPTRANK